MFLPRDKSQKQMKSRRLEPSKKTQKKMKMMDNLKHKERKTINKKSNKNLIWLKKIHNRRNKKIHKMKTNKRQKKNKLSTNSRNTNLMSQMKHHESLMICIMSRLYTFQKYSFSWFSFQTSFSTLTQMNRTSKTSFANRGCSFFEIGSRTWIEVDWSAEIDSLRRSDIQLFIRFVSAH